MSRYSLESFGMTKRVNLNALPTLEGRYRLAHAIADGLLSLLSVSWVHKSFCSWNILLFRSRIGHGAIDFAQPLIVGFGVARHEKPGEVTIDTRDLDSPLRLWQHPDLRGSTHVRFQPKHDIYSLGLVLFEIAMWQDLPSFDRREDLQTIQYSVSLPYLSLALTRFPFPRPRPLCHRHWAPPKLHDHVKILVLQMGQSGLDRASARLLRKNSRHGISSQRHRPTEMFEYPTSSQIPAAQRIDTMENNFDGTSRCQS
ncbi:uncharacterized protein B0I36DRAFT_356760 [Microdochium trichocladiopsis]|uniref:Protein kinase domain-containing protein n=1 Tax=Microdochium trichocladiopsis TaxID=1682393 RepID=A0A9P8XPG6_9PEZI|nr:uncharacterized protein B0I36DRAFT_356760 [Microdochium trichocladiopsis]KAH7009273.1 hypothetical protein B0I36DRAFT_356760 [Microdochium trichocladiopsis]